MRILQALFLSVVFLDISCSDNSEKQWLFAECNPKTYISPKICSENFTVEDINDNNPCSLFILEKRYGDEYSGFERCQSMFPDEKGYLTGTCIPKWSDCKVKYYVCWPNTARLSFDKTGTLTYISDDCLLIGETDIINELTRFVDITLYDFKKEDKSDTKSDNPQSPISFNVTVADYNEVSQNLSL